LADPRGEVDTVSHRSGSTSRHPSARDRLILALGIVLFVTGLGLSTCQPLDGLLEGSPAFEVRPTPAGGEQE